MGWAVPYGYVLEWGPYKKRVWYIKPKGFRSEVNLGRSGGGQALSFLRFEYKGKIVFARKVKHTWTRAQLRPHFEPWMNHYQRRILADIGDIPRQVIEGEIR
jgi:hypothetical protein